MTTKDDWAKVADLICQTLTTIYVTSPEAFEKNAEEMGATREQFAAMAITNLIEEMLSDKSE